LSKDQNPHSCTFAARLGDAATYLDVKRKLVARHRIIICHAIALNVCLSIADLTLGQGSVLLGVLLSFASLPAVHSTS
jgi:hypothetical protein